MLRSVCSGKASFNQLAMALKDNKPTADSLTISKQALHKRMNKHAVSFLLQVLKDLLVAPCSGALAEFKNCGFTRILVEDSTTLRLPKANANLFPAHGNASGATAGVKCNLCYDLLSQEAITFDLHRGTEQDRLIGKDTLALADKGDLVLRDMGYFDLNEFAYLEGIGAYWFTRMPLTVNLVSTAERSLEELLEEAVGDQIDCKVLVGKARHRCRLVAVRTDPQTAEKRRRERKQKARETGKTAPQFALIRDGWHLMLTNLPEDRITVATLVKLYRSRWAIEIQFRAWKQSTQITTALNRKSNKWHIEALICSAMIVALMGLKQIAIYARKQGLEFLSPEKLMDWLTEDILKTSCLTELASNPPAWRHVKREKRERKSTIHQGLTALS